jgi:hypothetical protein
VVLHRGEVLGGGEGLQEFLLLSKCTSSSTSTTGVVIDTNANPSRGTTDPGNELVGEVSASNTRPPTGSMAPSACAM